jgi:hypothetical protein
VSSPSKDIGRVAHRMPLLGATLTAGVIALATSIGVDASAGAAFGASAATASVTCTTPAVPMYHVDAQAQLRRWGLGSPLSGTPGWVEQQIGTGWSGLNVISGGGGMIYTIDQAGNLRWYDDDDFSGGGASWDPASGSVIGSGWNGFTTVVSGGGGVLYGVDSAGALHWYRDQAMNGTVSWAPGSGSVIGTGFGAPSLLIAGGQGVLYLVTSSGTLDWYRHLDPTGGTASWAGGGSGAPIGSGWSAFTRIASMGGGILVARDQSGGAWWYRDADPLGGTASWANQGNGIAEGTGWSGAQLVTDVTGCVAS